MSEAIKYPKRLSFWYACEDPEEPGVTWAEVHWTHVRVWCPRCGQRSVYRGGEANACASCDWGFWTGHGMDEEIEHWTDWNAPALRRALRGPLWVLYQMRHGRTRLMKSPPASFTRQQARATEGA